MGGGRPRDFPFFQRPRNFPGCSPPFCGPRMHQNGQINQRPCSGRFCGPNAATKMPQYAAIGRGQQGSLSNVGFQNFLAVDPFERPLDSPPVFVRKQRRLKTTTTTEATTETVEEPDEPESTPANNLVGASASLAGNGLEKREETGAPKACENPVYIVRAVYNQLVQQNLLNVNANKCIVLV